MRKLVVGSLVVVMALAVTVWGQTASQISGTVTDKTGAAVPGATVTITDTATGFHRVMVTNGTGAYAAGAMPAGTYDIGVTAHGFKAYAVHAFVLRPAQQAQLNATLQVGAVTSTVEVQGNAIAQVNLENAAVTNTINGKQVNQLELNGRDFVQLIALTPGVTGQGPTDEGVVGVYGGIGYNINGGRSTENSWEVDGTNVEDNGSNGTINVYPSVDAIDQVRILTSNYGAQYGRDASGTVIVTTKRGTNQWHGDAYEYLRNTDLNARPFFASSRPLYQKNDYGFTVGGPIIKNKTFIFWSSEWRKQSEPSLFNLAVPSAADRSGNFTDVCPAAGVAPGTMDPNRPANTTNTYQQDYQCPVMTQPTFNSSGAMTSPGAYYPNYTIPATSINQNGVDLLPYIPAATTVSGGIPTFVGSATYPTDWYESLFRIDQQFGNNWHLYYNFIHDSWNTVVPGALWDSASFPTVSTNFVGPGVAMVAHLTGVLSPTMTNEFVAGYTADHIGLTTNGPLARPSSFTMGGLFNNGFKGEIPGISVGNFDTNNSNGFSETGGDMPWFNSNPTYDYNDMVTQVVGNHVLTYGGELTAGQKNEMQGGYLQGSLGFGSGWAGSSGNGLADMLLGNIQSFNQINVQPKYYDRYKTGTLFLEDDWRTSSRLTLNLGLQADLLGAYYDSRGLLYNFEPGAYVAANAAVIAPNGSITNGGTNVNPNAAVVFNGLVNCGANGVPGSCNQNHLLNWAPRVGFAYDLFGTGKTSLRGGYGIFYDHTNSNDIVDALRNPPLQLSPTVKNVVGYQNVAAASGANFPLNLTGGGTIPAVGVWPMIQQWNLNIQHQLRSNLVFQVAYVGSKGTHLAQEWDLNQLMPLASISGTPYASGGALAGQPLNCTDPANPYLASGSAAPPASLMGTSQAWMINEFVGCGGNPAFYTKYPAYNDIGFLPFGANSNYNALQASFHGQIGGLFFTTAYTWSHSLDDASSRYDGSWYNGYDLAGAYGNSTFDQPQNFSASWVYALPFFKNNKWAGGWQYSGIFQAYSGTPFTVTNSNSHGDSAGVANGQTTGSYVNVVGNTAAPTIANTAFASNQLYANPAAFEAPVGLTFGNEGRDMFFGPGLVDFDMGLFKDFKITERQTIQFRWETFNTFNHANFSGVNSGASCFETDSPTGCLAGSSYLRSTGAHDPRIMQFALKWMF